MSKFWEIEEPDEAPEDFTQHGQCESIFKKQMFRHENGRFSVPLIFCRSVTDDTFRGSHAVALKRFESLERKLAGDSRLRESYNNFMSEYLSLGHMSPAKSLDTYFIPHHAVYKQSDIDKKLRVVTVFSGHIFK